MQNMQKTKMILRLDGRGILYVSSCKFSSEGHPVRQILVLLLDCTPDPKPYLIVDWVARNAPQPDSDVHTRYGIVGESTHCFGGSS